MYKLFHATSGILHSLIKRNPLFNLKIWKFPRRRRKLKKIIKLLFYIFLSYRRNDIISNVREAALVALKNIGGEKASEAIRVTTVLEKEIRALKT